MHASISTLTGPDVANGRGMPLTPAHDTGRDGTVADRPASLLTRVRVLILAFAILAAGFAAVAPNTAQDASAAGPCTVLAEVSTYASGGYLYVRGVGSTGCSRAVSQKITVSLFVNGVLQRSATTSAYTSGLGLRTSSVLGRCGTWYQAVTTHSVSGYNSTNTWSYFFKPSC